MNSGGGIRTRDLRVMSPTSYQTAPPRGVPSMIANGDNWGELNLDGRGKAAALSRLCYLTQIWHKGV